MTIAQEVDQHRYLVRPRHGAPQQAHWVEARSFEDAAVAYAERWSPPVDANEAVSVTVTDETGAQCCYLLDLDGVEPRPC